MLEITFGSKVSIGSPVFLSSLGLDDGDKGVLGGDIGPFLGEPISEKLGCLMIVKQGGGLCLRTILFLGYSPIDAFSKGVTVEKFDSLF